MRHLLNPLDFSVEEIDDLLALARDIESNLPKYAHVCDGKKLATLFYEPSTRTRLSHEAAMMNLGGNVLGFSFGSFQLRYQRGKRSRYDPYGFLLCRYLRYASSKRRCCLCGCTESTYPGHQRRWRRTPASNSDADWSFTIRTLKGHTDNMTIGLCGDLKFGRTVHSLIDLWFAMKCKICSYLLRRFCVQCIHPWRGIKGIWI